MQVQFWGTRGSIATPGPRTVRYGGNTSCVSLRTRRGTQIVLDAGTGMRGLGLALMEQGAAARRGHILIGHTHWDHIQGFPFFAPLFEAGHAWDVYAPRGFGASLRETLAGQMQYTYFPISLDAMGAAIRYHELVEGSFMIGEVRVTARYLNHPALTLGYRLEADGIAVVYSTDHECHARSAALGAPLDQVLGSLHPGDSRHRDFIAGADLLIHDAQYTAAEYPGRVGWGHSTLEYVVDLAIAGGVKRLELFHHDPGRDDEAVDTLMAEGRKRVAQAGAAVEVFAAAEGRVIELMARTSFVLPQGNEAELPDGPMDTGELASHEVLVVCSDSHLAQKLCAAVQAEGLSVAMASDAANALRIAHDEALALAIVERNLGADDGLALCRALRATGGMAQLPIIVVAPAGAPVELERAAADTSPDGPPASAVTDWLAAPFTSQYMRTKLRAGLLRTRARWQCAPHPANEAQRLAALRGLALLDTPAEERFDRITRLAARLFDVPIALISLVDQDRQWFKSRRGDVGQQTTREASFCAHAILDAQALVVHDALCDDRFADNPLVRSDPRVRFYAGQPLAAPDGSLVGTICLIDHQPRHFGEAELKVLVDLAALAERELDAGP